VADDRRLFEKLCLEGGADSQRGGADPPRLADMGRMA